MKWKHITKVFFILWIAVFCCINPYSQYVLQLNRQQRVRVKSFLRRESCLAKSWDVERALAWEDWIQCVQWTDTALLHSWNTEPVRSVLEIVILHRIFLNCLFLLLVQTHLLPKLFTTLGINKTICKEESRDLFTITYLKKNIILLLSFIVNHEFKFAF